MPTRTYQALKEAVKTARSAIADEMLAAVEALKYRHLTTKFKEMLRKGTTESKYLLAKIKAAVDTAAGAGKKLILKVSEYAKIAAVAFKTLCVWLNTLLNPFTKHFVCWEQCAGWIKELFNDSDVPITTANKDLIGNSIEYGKIDSVLKIFQDCLKALKTDLSTFQYGTLATTALSALIPGGAPVAVIGAAITIIVKLISNIVAGLYITVEAAWLITVGTADKARFDEVNTNLKRLSTESVLASWLPIPDYYTRLIARIELLAIEKVRILKNTTDPSKMPVVDVEKAAAQTAAVSAQDDSGVTISSTDQTSLLDLNMESEEDEVANKQIPLTLMDN